ncbi:Rap1a/Tai family immunity protein [Klebsiella aerogenes]|nr:Rap1a/Tai family immunity protein [Klebsiella aerogenes]
MRKVISGLIMFLTLTASGTYAAQNQIQSVLGNGYNPEKRNAAKAALGQVTKENSVIAASVLQGYVMAYLDMDYALGSKDKSTVNYCPQGSVKEITQKVAGYILSVPDAVNKPFTVLIPEALRAQYPCER